MSRAESIFVLLVGFAVVQGTGCGSDVTPSAEGKIAGSGDPVVSGETANGGESANGGKPANGGEPAASGETATGGKSAGGEDSQDAAASQSDAASNLPGLETEPATTELLVSLADGTVMWWHSDQTGLRRLNGSIGGPAFGMGFDGSSNLYVTHGFTQDLKAGNAIEVFDGKGTRVGGFGSAYDCNPHSIVFDAMKRAYVGQSDCEANILRLDATGALLDSFDVATEERGADWIALADDQCTMFYTSQGPNVKRYDVCTRKQLDDFNVVALPVDSIQGSGAQELKFVPGGGLLVANFTEIVLLDAAGVQSRVYDMVGPDGWRGVDMDLGGTSFWASNYSTSDVVRFDIPSGKILERFNTGTLPMTVKSVVVKRP